MHPRTVEMNRRWHHNILGIKERANEPYEDLAGTMCRSISKAAVSSPVAEFASQPWKLGIDGIMHYHALYSAPGSATSMPSIRTRHLISASTQIHRLDLEIAKVKLHPWRMIETVIGACTPRGRPQFSSAFAQPLSSWTSVRLHIQN